MEKKYVLYRCPDGSLILDWGDTLWISGYPAYPKHRCIEIERGIPKGGTALVKLYAKLVRAYT